VNQTKTKDSGIQQTNEAYFNATQYVIATGTQKVKLTEARSTELAIEFWSLTQTAIPTSTPTTTQTTTPTLTHTPTITSSATTTSTFTPPPEGVTCLGTVANRDDLNVYSVPSSVMIDNSLSLEKKQEVIVIGRLQDGPWIKVNINGNERWMNSSDVEINQTCTPSIFDLSYLLGEAGLSRLVLIDDTFSTNKYSWVDFNGENIYPTTTNAGNDTISIDTTSSIYVYSKVTNLDFLDNYRLITSFTRYGNDKENASIGIIFGINGDNPYTVALSSTCQVRIEGESNIYKKQLSSSVCSSVDNYLVIDKAVNGELSISINGSDPIIVILPPEYNTSLNGNIGFEITSSKAFFDYIVLTTSR